LQAYLEDYLDYLIALDRLNDKDDKVVSCDELLELVGAGWPAGLSTNLL
jgi:hypothetical protein